MTRFATATRRQLIGRAGALAGLGAAGGTVAVLLSAAPAQAETDAEALRTLGAAELLGVFVYQRAIQSGLLSAETERLASKLLGHEQAHAHAVELELRARGQAPPPAPASASAADRTLAHLHVSASLTALHSEHDWIKLLLDVEVAAEGAYYDAISKLGDPVLLRLAAESMASEAQHATLLSQALNGGDVIKAVPDAFVEGKH